MEIDTADFGVGDEDASLHDRETEERKTANQESQQEDLKAFRAFKVFKASEAWNTFEASEAFEAYKAIEDLENFPEDSGSMEDKIDEYSGDVENHSIGEIQSRDARGPTYCPICLETADLVECQGCHDMTYCSKACQRVDWPVHKYLCRKLLPFRATARPKGHVRAILFPANTASIGEFATKATTPKPKFVWSQKWDYAAFFPPHGTSKWKEYKEDDMGRRQRVTTQRLRIVQSERSLEVDEPRNGCIEAVGGNRLLMRPWPQPGWRGDILVVGYKGDVTMRDFRAIVDFFQCYPYNLALIDPSRYIGNTLVGVLTIPNPYLSAEDIEAKVPEALEVRVTDMMVRYRRKKALGLLNNLLAIDVLLVRGSCDNDSESSRVLNLNTYSLLLMVSASIERSDKVGLPLDWLPCGPIIYLRKDGKPLLKHHYEAVSAFVCGAAIEAAGAQGLSKEMMVLWDYEATRRDLEPLLTKDRFREFWDSYCEKNGLEKTPCPLDM
ncbi:hypothetical protein VPNG_01934 [Cytospora leucostoma]|uniref:MYND-type domain-containing protein n=1 Tax=Cytospora leucostoma TaxID=1230097 RepID=A0A423XJ90_9PEZI|nr:hypothetical protein VPNG_01934 [Cytospora leucostoma]